MRSVRVLVTVFAVARLASACGDAGGATTTTSGSTRLDVVGLDFAFSPDAWQLNAGAEVEVRLANEGTIAHEWIVLSDPIDEESEYSPDNALILVTAAPGTTGRGTLIAPAAGTYQVVCSVAGHFEAGMVGELTVRS